MNRGFAKRANPRMRTRLRQASCVHFWKIEAPDGPESEGACSRCGARQMFRNGFDEKKSGWWRRVKPLPEDVIVSYRMKRNRK